MSEENRTVGIGNHGASRLPSVEVDCYYIAFQDILDAWRKPLKKSGDEPFGGKSSEDLSKKKLDEILVGDDIEAAAVLHSAIEEFAQELAFVTRRYLKSKAWEKTEAIVVGGGFRQSRIC